MPGDVDTLRSLQARNTYNLVFTSDTARARGVSLLTGVDGLTVTPYERIAVVTVLHVNYEVPQSVVAVALGRYGRVLSQHMPTYLEYPTVKTGGTSI